MSRDHLRRRKNFLPTFLLAALLWIIWAVIFFFVPPETFLLPAVFLILTFLVVFFSAALIFANTRRGLLTALGVVTFMILNFYGLGNFLNAILLVGLLLTLEYYLSTSR